jgi:phage-related protein
MEEKFNVVFLDEVIEFFDRIEEKARYKIIFNIRKAKQVNDRKLFIKLTDEIWEFRTLYNKTQYRLFAFWDKTDNSNVLVIATHGIIKKTKKTPKKEIVKALKIMRKYFEEK